MDSLEIEPAETTSLQNAAILNLFYDLPFIGMAITLPTTNRWLKFNDRLCEIYGYSREELPHIAWTEITHPDDLDLDLAEYEKVMRGESDGYVMDKRFIRKDGQLIYASINVKSVRKEDGTVDFFVATVQDISDRKLAEAKQKQIEKALAESEERYRQVVQTQMDFVLRSLPDTTITFANESLCRALGMSLEQVIGLKWVDLAPPEELQNTLHQISLLSPSNPSFLGENHDKRADGQIGYTQWINQGIFDDQGQLIRLQSAGRDVTALKQAEIALHQLNEELEIRIEQRTADLKQSKARNLAILQALPDLLLILKPDGTCVECIMPSTFDKALYLPIHSHISEVLSPEALAKQVQIYEKAVATGEVQIYEHQLTKFGKTVHEEVRITPYNNDELLVIVRDISDRKQAEELLLKSDTHLKTAQRIGKLGSWEFDLQTGNVSWSEEVFRIFGRDPKIGAPTYSELQNYVHPDDWEHFNQAVEQSIATAKSYDVDYRICWADGTLLYVSARGEIICDLMGQPIQIIGTVIDITSRKQAEQLLLKSDTHLKVAQRIGKVGSWEFEINTGHLSWSDEIFHIYGLEPIPQPPSYEELQQYIHPDDWEHFNQTVQNAINLAQSYDLEHRVVQPNGAVVHVMARGEMIYDSSGQLTHIIGTAMDISDRKLAEAKILETAHQLANTNRELEAFSYSVSHDLRAPLRHMNGFVNALKQQLQKHHEVLNDPKVAHYLQVIESSSKKMGHLIDGLLTLSRYGRRTLDSSQLSIRELVDEAIAIISSDPHHNSSIEFAIADLPTKFGDRLLLQQVFNNLIGNAVKFSKNQPKPCVEIDSLPDGTIRIKDNGVGFQMEYADKLFGAFQRLHNQSEFEGTGIGLAIVQRIVQRHGGSVWAEGYPNQGATFFVKI